MNTNEKSKNQKSTGNIVVSVILFILTGMAIIFAVRQFIYCHEDVLSAIDQGMTLVDNFGDIIFYYLESCGQYLFTGGILFSLGWIILNQGKPAAVAAGTSHYQPDSQQQRPNGGASSDESSKSDKADEIDAFVEEEGSTEKKDGNTWH